MYNSIAVNVLVTKEFCHSLLPVVSQIILKSTHVS